MIGVDAARRRSFAVALLAMGLAATAACGTAQAPQQATLTSAESTTTPSGHASQEVQIAPEPTGGPTPTAGRPWDAAVSAACEEAVGSGYSQVAQSADDGGVTTFWTRGRGWRVCDLADVPGAEPTVFGPGARGRGLDVPQLAISASSTAGEGGQAGEATTRLVAGGVLPWPVDEIRYDLPDGASVAARFVTSAGDEQQTWWVMSHDIAESSLVGDPGPVTVSVVGGAAEAFRVPWEQIQRSEG